MKLCRILVPTNFSACADAAFQYATHFAWRVGGSIDLLYVSPSRLPDDSSDRLAMLKSLTRTHRYGAVEVRARLGFGEVCETIARVATQDRFDLVVMGSGADGRRSVRSVSRTVAQRVECPTIRVPATMVAAPLVGRSEERRVQGVWQPSEVAC